MSRQLSLNQQARATLLFLVSFATAYAAEQAGGPFDPDSLPSVTLGWLLFYTLIGWGAAGLESLVDLINKDPKARLIVGQKFLAALGAGMLSGMVMLAIRPEWGKLAAYVIAFCCAYGGAAYINLVVAALGDIVRALIARAAAPKVPTDKP